MSDHVDLLSPRGPAWPAQTVSRPAPLSAREGENQTTRDSSLVSRTVNHRKLRFPNRTDLEITCNCSIQVYYLLILIGGGGQSGWIYVKYHDKK